MSIVTKTGDAGETSLMFGRRVAKTDPRVDAYGSVDELTAALGLARALCHDDFIAEQVLTVQKELITVMGELATATQDMERYVKEGFKLTTAAMADRIGAVITAMENDQSLYPKDWVIPGATPGAAALDLARTACRRAERKAVALGQGETGGNPEIVRYLNRLSDFCWLLARYAERHVPGGKG
jgi:cob(I)alamin adenosyltransferase